MNDTAQKIIVLKTKLLIPHLPDTIDRERLYPLFAKIRQKKILTVIAGAGYGKTTFTANACRHFDTDTVWYRLDSSDGDVITFIHYVVEGIKQYYADFGIHTIHRINTAQTLKREQRAILTVLLNEIEDVVFDDLIIILDDYHLIQDSQDIQDMLAFMAEHLPEKLHLVLISRSVPDLNLSRFIARREALDISEKELTFDIQEIDTLFQDIFDISLEKKDLEILHKKTDGWASGLILFNYSLKNGTPIEIEKQLTKLQGTRKIIFNYLEENIYNLLSEDLTSFLLKTSILSRLDIKFCNQFLNIENSMEIMMNLEEKHLFTFPFAEKRDSYYFHHLFREFLQAKLKQELDEESRHNLHSQAAHIWEKHGEPEEALHHYLVAELYEKACSLLQQIGRQMINSGRVNIFSSCFHGIPYAYIEKEPWVQYSYGRALDLSGKVQEAIQAFNKAKVMFQNCDIPKGVGQCLNHLASNYYVIGDFQKAEGLLKELLQCIRNTPRRYVDALGHLIFTSAHLGKLDEADCYYDEAMKTLAGSTDTYLHAWIYINYGLRYFTSGDMFKAIAFGEKGITIAHRLKIHYLLILGYHLISISKYYLGDVTGSYDIAQTGLKLGNEKGIRETSYTWLLIDTCFSATEKGNTSEAIHYGREALTLCKELQSRWSEAWANHALQLAYTRAGNLLEAEKSARSAVNAIQDFTLPYDEGIMKGGLAAILLKQDLVEDAGPLLKEAENKLDKSKLNLCWVYLHYAMYYWKKKQTAPALDKLHSALTLSEKHHYEAQILKEKEWIIPLLVELYPGKKLQPFLKKIFMQLGLNAVNDLTQIQQTGKAGTTKAAKTILNELGNIPPLSLKIHCFGKFRLFCGDDKILPEKWSSQKAKTLFKYLAFHHTRGYLHKDKLLEFLWPEEDPEKTSNRLRVALTTLRKILEPGLLRGSPSSYVLRKGDSYRLHLGKDGYLDIDTFDSEVTLSKHEKDSAKALSHCLRAEALYAGGLFEEDQYMEWVMEKREIYKDKYLDILKYIISWHNEKKAHESCIEYTKKYVKLDEYAEDMYQLLMTLYSKTGNRAMIVKTYETCKLKLEKDLGYPLTTETEELYKKIKPV